MNTKRLLWSALVIALVILGGWLAFGREAKAPTEGGMATTTTSGEDGPVASVRTRVTAAMDESMSALGVSVRPLELVEDSRCPRDVTCIQAGTVRIRAEIVSGLGTSPMTLTLGQPITTEAESVTLVEVAPLPVSTDPLEESEYRFTFEIAKRPMPL